ncbi:MAG: hypothetical protein IV097_21945 [Burkholderiaceae bacterium]|nr:hypothetical protein [Burkholderiaceae bacterium]
MLLLNAEQTQALQALKLERDIRRLSEALATGFPEIPGRLAERYEQLVRHGVQRGAVHGLTHAVCVARYLACWFMLGAEFETRPGFVWAQDLLTDGGRPEGAKVFQLCRRTREELARLALQAAPPQGLMPPALFDQAIAGLDAALMERGMLGSLLPGSPVQLGEACDIDALDLRLLESGMGLQYRVEQGQWRRLPAEVDRSAITLSAGAGPRHLVPQSTAPDAAAVSALPARLNVLSQPAGRDVTRLRLRTRAAACCDPKVHPLAVLNGPRGVSDWRGQHANDVLLNLYADTPAPPPGDALQPVIAAEGPAQISVLELSSCGLRDAGQSLGTLSTQIAVYPAEQHLMAWKREPGPAMTWPETPAAPTTTPPSRFRIERDGLALEASRWQAGLEDLDRQLIEGLGRLATAWERESGVSRGSLQAQPMLLSGTAGLSWGWAEGEQGMRSMPFYRVAGLMDLVACQLNLRLSGDLALHGSLSRLTLHCAGSAPLQLSWQRGAKDADLMATLAPAQTQFRHPFVLQLEATARDELAVLDIGCPVVGALVGSCGLRPKAEGPGLQWFAKLEIAPASVILLLHDPLLGQRELVRPLLPAMKLLDWSLG